MPRKGERISYPLESGAAAVHLYARRASIEQPSAKAALEFAGFLRHYGSLDDLSRWRVMRQLARYSVPPPPTSIERCTRHAGFEVSTSSPWLSVRLALAIPITVAEKKFAFFDSFKVTAGRVWGLIGMAIIAFVMTMVVGILTMIIFFPITMGMGATVDWESLEGMNAVGIMQAVGPIVFVMIVLQAISSALSAAVMYAPFAGAYRDLKGGTTPELA